MNTVTTENQFAMLASTGGYGFSNFDPAFLQEEEVIICPIAIDISPSMQPYTKELNEAFEAFITEMQGNTHVVNKLMVKSSEFNEDVKVRAGFMPVTNVDTSNFKFRPCGEATALADAALEAVDSAVEYKEKLEQSGITCKVIVFVITDGIENASKSNFTAVKRKLDDVMKNEKNVFSFETILFGIGDRNNFEPAQKAMGFKHLAVVGQTGKDVRKLIGFISASISKSSSGQQITF